MGKCPFAYGSRDLYCDLFRHVGEVFDGAVDPDCLCWRRPEICAMLELVKSAVRDNPDDFEEAPDAPTE